MNVNRRSSEGDALFTTVLSRCAAAPGLTGCKPHAINQVKVSQHVRMQSYVQVKQTVPLHYTAAPQDMWSPDMLVSKT